jgi:hypothetical protein
MKINNTDRRNQHKKVLRDKEKKVKKIDIQSIVFLQYIVIM